MFTKDVRLEATGFSIVRRDFEPEFDLSHSLLRRSRSTTRLLRLCRDRNTGTSTRISHAKERVALSENRGNVAAVAGTLSELVPHCLKLGLDLRR